MKRISSIQALSKPIWVVSAVAWLFLVVPERAPGQQSASKPAPTSVGVAKTFNTAQQAADALVDAAQKFDVGVLVQIFGPDGADIVLSGEYPQDRQRALDFAAEASEKKSVSVDPKTGNRAFLLVGNEDWPFPVPIVKVGDKWRFDAKAGRQELLYRRIGSNELDAIDICHGYVEAQYEYAYQKREGYDVNQYAQRILSTPGKQDGLAWQNADGSWGGPVGEEIARAIEQGYSANPQPYHGYFFKVLKGQGPAAPLGEMDYVMEGVMIGGFALVAAPAEYGETGVKSFMVSQDGVVYQKDFGPSTLNEFIKAERFNPDKTWAPVPADALKSAKRYAWGQNHIIARQGKANDALIDQKIVEDVNRILATKGFIEDPTNPDFYISYDASSPGLSVDVEGAYTGHPTVSTATIGPVYGIPQNVWYSVDGQITFHMVDAKSKKPVWTAKATKKIRDPRMKDMPKQVDQLVSKAFKKFPPTTG